MSFHHATLMVTGGAGFIGSNFIRRILEREPSVRIVNLDAVTYAGNPENLADVERRFGACGDRRYRFVRGDIRDADLVSRLLRGGSAPAASPPSTPPPHAIVHFAAESHVDRSIMDPRAFVRTNVEGTLTLLEAARAELDTHQRPLRFLHVSTDEVYGTLGPHDPPFTERTALAPNSPYAASKAGADLLVRAYARTFGLDAVIARCSNTYGPYQFPEKLVPLTITRALADRTVPVYGSGTNIRDWMHVDDQTDGVWTLLCGGDSGNVYNLAGNAELPNIEIVRRILALLNKPDSLIQFVDDRPGHDWRYAMDTTKANTELGWRPRRDLDTGLRETVAWYVENQSWSERVLGEAYRAAEELYLRAGPPWA